MSLKITLGAQNITGQSLPPFDGLDFGEKLIYVYGFITPSGSYPGAPTFTFTSVANSSGGNAVYTGTITGGANNAFVGMIIIVTGFTGTNNNGSFICVASTASNITLNNASATAETHAATGTGAGGDTLDFTTAQPAIASSYVPLFVSMYSQQPGGASGYFYFWRPGVGVPSLHPLSTGKMQVFQASGGTGPHSELPNGPYPSGIINDVIVFSAVFTRV